MRVLNCGGAGGKPGPCPSGGVAGRAAKGVPVSKMSHESLVKAMDVLEGKRLAIEKKHKAAGNPGGHQNDPDHKRLTGKLIEISNEYQSRKNKAGRGTVGVKHPVKWDSNGLPTRFEVHSSVQTAAGTPNSPPGGSTVKKLNRAKYIAALTGNCDCWKGGETVLNQLTDDQLRAVKGGADLEAEALAAYNAATGAETVTQRGLLEFVANAGKKPCGDDEAAEGETEGAKGKKMTGNTNPFAGLTEAEAFDILPAPLKKIVANAKKVEDNRKAELVGLLTSNCTKDKKAKAEATYNKMDLDDLEDLAAALPVKNNRAEDDNPFRRPAPVGNTGGDEDDEDGLFLNAALPANRVARYGPADGDRTGPAANSRALPDDEEMEIPTLDEAIAANCAFSRTRAESNGKAK